MEGMEEYFNLLLDSVETPGDIIKFRSSTKTLFFFNRNVRSLLLKNVREIRSNF